MRSTMHSIVAFTDDGSIAGEIRWFKKGGEIALVWVVPHLQRRRIATILFAAARRRQPDLHHSAELSADARAWIDSLKARHLALAG
jgi:GNAT superfamily N-acetyltransferase